MWFKFAAIFLRTLQQRKEYSSNFVQFKAMQSSRLSYTTWPVKHPRENERVKSFWCLKFGLSIWMEKVRCGEVSRFKWWNIGYEISPTTTTRLRQIPIQNLSLIVYQEMKRITDQTTKLQNLSQYGQVYFLCNCVPQLQLFFFWKPIVSCG
jgi:hypothetical protein